LAKEVEVLLQKEREKQQKEKKQIDLPDGSPKTHFEKHNNLPPLRRLILFLFLLLLLPPLLPPFCAQF